MKIPFDAIAFDAATNYRSRYSDASISELADSMESVHAQTGGARYLLQPVGVQPLALDDARQTEGKTHEVVFGYRRYYAIEELVLDRKREWAQSVEVVLQEPGATELSTLLSQLVENLQREDPNVMDTALALDRLRDLLGEGKKATHRQLADHVGKSESWVSQRLRLLSMHDAVKTALQAGDIEISHARELQRLGKGCSKKEALKQQAELLALALQKGWTYDQLKARVQRILDVAAADAAAEGAEGAEGAAAPPAPTAANDDTAAPQAEGGEVPSPDFYEPTYTGEDAPPRRNTEDRMDARNSGETTVGPTTQDEARAVTPHRVLNAQSTNLKRSVIACLQEYKKEDDAVERQRIAREAAFFAGAQRALAAMLTTDLEDVDFEALHSAFLADAARFGVGGGDA